jgi:hypothetical protein
MEADMARHESEMHRQRRALADHVMRLIWLCDELAAGNQFSPDLLQKWSNRARADLSSVARHSDINMGLFGDHRQMDLQDRTDLQPNNLGREIAEDEKRMAAVNAAAERLHAKGWKR